jgi:hypothetical protein
MSQQAQPAVNNMDIETPVPVNTPAQAMVAEDTPAVTAASEAMFVDYRSPATGTFFCGFIVYHYVQLIHWLGALEIVERNIDNKDLARRLSAIRILRRRRKMQTARMSTGGMCLH